jgi:hypothetical protein
MRIEITVREVYGETKYYPANVAAHALAAIAGTKTLTKATVRQAINGLGAEVWEFNPRNGAYYLMGNTEFLQ